MNYTTILNYIKQNGDIQKVMDVFTQSCNDNYAPKEALVHCHILTERIDEEVNLWKAVLENASSPPIIDFCNGNVRKVYDVVSDLNFAKKSIELYIEGLKVEKPKKEIVFDKLPDFLTPEDLSELFGWTISTIASKKSRNEIPYIEGINLFPKKELFEMLAQKTKNPFKNYDEILDGKIKRNRSKS